MAADLVIGFKKCKKKVIVIGGGAAGMIAAGRAAELGAKVLLIEKNKRLGAKVLISGKERCNVSNSAPLEKFILMYGENGKFLHNAFSHFFTENLIQFLKSFGVKTKIERGGRIFPESNRASDIVNCFEQYLRKNKVQVLFETSLEKISVENQQVNGIITNKGFFEADSVILSTGGASFKGTGSTGDGYKIVQDLGHTIVPLLPALVPLIVKEKEIAVSMQGVSLKNVRLTAFECDAENIDDRKIPNEDIGRGFLKKAKSPLLESHFGEMIFTHFGLGGPIVLLISLAVAKALQNNKKASVSIDLKPALSKEQLKLRLQRDFDKFGKKQYKNILSELLPKKMIEPFILLSKIPENKIVSTITSIEKDKIASLLKSFRFNILSTLPLNSAIVTAGGVSLKEVNPKTLESKIIKNLFFAGEILDIDANTGGYNLQAAFSMGFLAGTSVLN